MIDRPLVLLVTCSGLPAGEQGHEALDVALAERGLESRWVVWDDPSVDWSRAAVVAVRSTWDYHVRVEEFLAWANAVGPRLLNGARVFGWTTDKRYLLDLIDAGLPVVPTSIAATVPQVRRLAERHDVAVVKPCVGASGRGLELVEDPARWEPGECSPGPWVVQPLVESIHDDGETSVFVFGGRPVGQVEKLPGGGDVRVHERFGGRSRPAPLAPDAATLATTTIGIVAGLLDAEIVYGRIDLMRHGGRLVVSEVEVTEPGLYLDVLPANAGPFADAVVEWLRGSG